MDGVGSVRRGGAGACENGFRLNGAESPSDSELKPSRGTAQERRSPGEVVRRIWRAPREHGTAVVAPAWHDIPAVLSQNQQEFTTWRGEIAGQTWAVWRLACRSEAQQAAVDYLRNTLGFDDASPLNPHAGSDCATSGPWLVGGHQPELFHSGVWAKNYALGRLASQTSGVALNLIVDSDVSNQSSITVPIGNREQPQTMSLPFDAPRPLQPWEISRVQDARLFQTFAERLTTALAGWGIDPLVNTAWPFAVGQSQSDGGQHGQGVASALTAARVGIERRWGVRNLELPLSRVCELPSFLQFAAEILLRLPEFQRHHNDVLRDYRQLNRVRSRSHPVPELATEGDWREAPFWVWRDAEPRRDRLWVRRQGRLVELRDAAGLMLSTLLPDVGDSAALALALGDLAPRGIRLRTRALTTTLFARLGLADLFLHGLGGAKYDEMTDALLARFFQITPPTFLTVTATLHLPLGGRWPATAAQRGDLLQAERDLQQNPHRHLIAPLTPTQQQLVEARRAVLSELHGKSASNLTRGQRRQHYLRLQEINAALASGLQSELQRCAGQLERIDQQIAANRVLADREYRWVTFPEDLLRTEYDRLFPGQTAPAPATGIEDE